MNKNKIIKWLAVALIILVVVLFVLIVFWQSKPDIEKDTGNTNSTISDVVDTDDQNNTDDNADKTDDNKQNGEEPTNDKDSTTSSDGTELDKGTTSDDDSQNSNNDKDGDGIDDDFTFPKDPDTIIMNWEDFVYPKDRVQAMVDELAYANALITSRTGETIFCEDPTKLSTEASMIFISEYGSQSIFPERIFNYGSYRYIEYPDYVLFGLSLLMGVNVDFKDIPTERTETGFFRDKDTQTTTYILINETPTVVDTFEVIKWEMNGDSLDIYGIGKGRFAGGTYKIRLVNMTEDLWGIKKVTKI